MWCLWGHSPYPKEKLTLGQKKGSTHQEDVVVVVVLPELLRHRHYQRQVAKQRQQLVVGGLLEGQEVGDLVLRRKQVLWVGRGAVARWEESYNGWRARAVCKRPEKERGISCCAPTRICNR